MADSVGTQLDETRPNFGAGKGQCENLSGQFGGVDLHTAIPAGGSYAITRGTENPEQGIIKYFDADGNAAGQIDLAHVDKVVACFTPGTRIATPRGEVSIGKLKVGDRVITRDNGLQTIRWIYSVEMSAADFRRKSHLAPVLILKGALGNDLPERDMMVSPNHRMLVANDKTILHFEESEVLVAAKYLTGLVGVTRAQNVDTTYIHLLFDQHEVILSDGTWSESFQPSLNSLAGVGNAQRNELLELFPDLGTRTGIERYASARRSVTSHVVGALVE